jgi:mono/diheme cytochrome c family protein
VISVSAGESECAAEIGGTLEGYGVVPAEKLVPLDIRDLLHLPAPPRDLDAALAGKPLYAEHCAKCHGPEAVAATDALAPVDLLVSVRRFSYPGFLYIVLNGRSKNGMPGFRGSLDRGLVEQIYRYVRERSHGEIAASGP